MDFPAVVFCFVDLHCTIATNFPGFILLSIVFIPSQVEFVRRRSKMMKFLCVAAVFGIVATADDVNEGPFTAGVGPTYYNNGVAKSVYGYDDTKTVWQRHGWF